MTTLLADSIAGVMVADTGAGDGDRQWPNARKVWRVRGALLGFSGYYEDIERFLAWWRAGQPPQCPRFTHGAALVLSARGLALYSGSCVAQPVDSGRDAIGTGGKAALCAYDALGWADARRAVQIACKYDAASRTPVRCYVL